MLGRIFPSKNRFHPAISADHLILPTLRTSLAFSQMQSLNGALQDSTFRREHHHIRKKALDKRTVSLQIFSE
jgi:hypothetical protein